MEVILVLLRAGVFYIATASLSSKPVLQMDNFVIQVAVAMDLFELDCRKSPQALKHSLIDQVEGCSAISSPCVSFQSTRAMLSRLVL